MSLILAGSISMDSTFNIIQILLAHHAWSSLPICGGWYRCANILAHLCIPRKQLPDRGHISHVVVSYNNKFTLHIGGPNSSVRLAYFHANCLFTWLYKTEMEVRWRKNDVVVAYHLFPLVSRLDRHVTYSTSPYLYICTYSPSPTGPSPALAKIYCSRLALNVFTCLLQRQH